MIFTVGRCVLCGLRSVPKRCNAITALRSAVQSRRSVSDSRRPQGFDELLRSDTWNRYLQRLQQWGAEAAQGADDDQQGAPSWRTRGDPGWSARHILPVIQELKNKEKELIELQQLVSDENEELKALASTEVASCVEDIINLKYQIAWLLIPKEEVDDCNVILEVTAGVGGQEAMLFTAEIFEMYQRYAAYKRWSFDILEYFNSDLGGVRHAAAAVGGEDAYKHLKYEGGVHRVQRVPKTEKQGRMHTSTMTVAVLPQPNEINLTVNPKDLRIDTKRASGAGGQHVNTTDSAVRIVHIPTGIVAECQQERSQIKNKDIAMKVLLARLYNMKLEEETLKRQSARNIQVGTKGRSEKIRTYNFQQDRITDHRINKSMHNIEGFLLGDELLDEMIQALSDFADYESLMQIVSN